MQSDDVKLFAFDMGHVIIDFEWHLVCDGFCRRAGLASENFGPVLQHLGSLGYESGRIGTTDFLKELNLVLKTDIDGDEFNRLWNATFRENTEMAALLMSLKQRYPLYLLSNTNESHYQFIQQNYNVARHFDELILSYEVGSIKPDLRIYQEVISRSGFDPTHCVFIDDLHDNVAAARSLGMQGIVFSDYDALVKQLEQIGVTMPADLGQDTSVGSPRTL